ncbi:MAG TPA: efflux RND transporter permease subunit [Bacteroidales bacterium]|nr:efflux RND transporter permease subunit [Bacteroidales bacterium]
MVRYLIKRPVGVLMVFLALLLLGIFSFFFIPVSLLPDIDAPQISVKIDYPGKLAMEIEQSVTSPLRFQLQQVSRIESLESETRDNEAVITIRFKYGTNGDNAFFDVNEKLDLAMSYIPREVQRPRVIKSSESVLPIFNINVFYRDSAFGTTRMLELSQLIQFVIKKRLEQLPEVALTDISGVLQPEVRIIPDEAKLMVLGISYQQISNAINRAMSNLGTIKYKQGQLVFDVTFESEVGKPDDIANLAIEASGRVFRLAEIATITQCPQNSKGLYVYNGKPAVSIAVLKTSNSKISDLKTSIFKQLELFRSEYPDLEFAISNDQSRILDLSMSNLKSSLLIGILLAIGVMFLFMGDYRSPFIMAITIPVSLVISVFLFYLVGLSVNIISLAGLILGVGMMVDNSIVVIDNINQWHQRGELLEEAVVKGTNEVITPLLSSMLTTCAVFLPLIFLSGIAGELFYDQAMAVTIGLIISFWVSITLIPTLYFNSNYFKSHVKYHPIFPLEKPYLIGHNFLERRKRLVLIFTIAMFLLSPIVFNKMEKQQIPTLSHRELMVDLTWSDKVSVEENYQRFSKLVPLLESISIQNAAYIGRQQYLLVKGFEQEENQVKIYKELIDTMGVDNTKKVIANSVKGIDNNSDIKFSFPETVFDRVFPSNSHTLLVKIYPGRGVDFVTPELIGKKLSIIRRSCNSSFSFNLPDSLNRLSLRIIPERLLVYHVSVAKVIDGIRKELGAKRIADINYEQQVLPIYYGSSGKYIESIISEATVENDYGELVPVRQLVQFVSVNSLRTVFADATGLYYPINIEANVNDQKSIIENLRRSKIDGGNYSLGFSGDYFKSQKTTSELVMVLLVSVLLLYFIMAAQFESLWQPLIVLIELPVDFCLAIVVLWLLGGTINVMSLIGLVVMGGIIINDSILKIDTINRLLKKGFPIEKAVKLAGVRRVKAIVMTSATTALAIMPILFGTDIGSELQRPMSIVLFAGMILGTLVSLFVIPLLFAEFYKLTTRAKYKH